jgi:hypothetical protein
MRQQSKPTHVHIRMMRKTLAFQGWLIAATVRNEGSPYICWQCTPAIQTFDLPCRSSRYLRWSFWHRLQVICSSLSACLESLLGFTAHPHKVVGLGLVAPFTDSAKWVREPPLVLTKACRDLGKTPSLTPSLMIKFLAHLRKAPRLMVIQKCVRHN